MLSPWFSFFSNILVIYDLEFIFLFPKSEFIQQTVIVTAVQYVKSFDVRLSMIDCEQLNKNLKHFRKVCLHKNKYIFKIPFPI